MSVDHLHSLLHMKLVDWVSEFTGFAHVELTYLGMLVNFIETWMKQHQGFLGLLPTEVKSSRYILDIDTEQHPGQSDIANRYVVVDIPIAIPKTYWHSGQTKTTMDHKPGYTISASAYEWLSSGTASVGHRWLKDRPVQSQI